MLQDFLTELISLDEPGYSKSTNTAFRRIDGSYTNIGSFDAQTQLTDSRILSLDERSQEGRIDTYAIVLLKVDCDNAINFDYTKLGKYRVTMPEGSFGRIVQVDINTSPSAVIQPSVILTVEVTVGG